MIERKKIKAAAAIALLFGLAIGACHKEEQAVVGVAQNAVNAEQKAQAAAQTAATERDRQRTALAVIPLPTKSMYVDVHEPGAWANPFLSIDADTFTLRITLADANTSAVGQGGMLRPEAARRQEIQIRPADLPQALIALPAGCMALWPRDRRRRVAAGQQEGPPESPAQRRSRHPAAQRPRRGRGRVAGPVGPPTPAQRATIPS